VFDRHEAAAFLRRRIAGDNREAAEALARELGELPLALEQAAAFMEQTGLGLSEYLKLYCRAREVLLAKGEPVAYGATVDTTFRLAIEKVAERSQAAVELLELCGFLAPEAIPHDLLTAKPGVLPAALGQVIQDEVAYAEAVGVLHGLSLADRDPAGLRVHRLVQAVTRNRLMPDQQAAWAGRAVELVWASWPGEPWWPASWPRCGQLLPHALTATHHAVSLATAREQSGALLNRAGQYLAGRAQLPAARATLERALTITEMACGPDHPLVAHILENLGYVFKGLGELPVARARAEEALRIEEAAYGADHPNVAGALSNLGTILVELGQLSAARATFERALAIFEAAWGPDHPDVGRTLDNLGVVLRELGELPEARARAERALAIFEATYGPDHPEVAETLGDLGRILRELGELPEARARAERALAIFEATYGPDHPHVAITLGELGTVLAELGKLAEAEACDQRAQKIRQKLNSSG
jgi:tetratricopeptide (TPR) repeat protein